MTSTTGDWGTFTNLTSALRGALALALALALLARPAQTAVPAVWESRGVGGGGAMFSPSFSPHAASEMFVACDMSQLFRTTDLGRSWTTLDFRSVQSFHEAKVQYTSDPNVLYVIDYTSSGGSDWSRPSRSDDGGSTFTVLPGDPTGGFAWLLFADPGRTDRLFVTDYAELYFSDDGGATFASRYTALDNNAGLHIAGVLWDGANIFIGTNDGLLMSGNGGQSFALAAVSGIPAGEHIVGFAGARAASTTRLVAVTSSSAYAGIQAWDHWDYTGVYTLDWGAPSWVARGGSIAAGHHPWFAAMSNGNIDVAYLGGGSDSGLPTVYRTGDGGASWQSVFQAVGNANVATGWSGHQGDRQWTYGEVALGFAASPIDGNRVAFTDYGFVHTTTDGGASWQQAYVDPADQNPPGAATPKYRSYRGVGIEDTTSWCVAWADVDHLFACFSDIQGIRSTDGGDSWGFDYTGHNQNSMYRVVRHADGTLYGATSSVHDLYQSTYLTDARIDGGSGRVVYSDDLGRTWQQLHDFGHVVSWVALDPTRPTRLYASVVHSVDGGIYVSDDIQNGAASSWSRLPSPPRTEGHPFNIVVLGDGAVVASFSGRRAGSPTNFTASSGVFLSTDGGLTWQDRSDPGMRYWTKDVVVSPSDPTGSTWYAGVFSGWGGSANDKGGLYRTRDRGLNWTRLVANEGVTSLTIDPTSPDAAYMTTQVQGLWHTENLSAPSPAFTQTTYPFRQPERVFFNPYDVGEVWVTSFGNGLRVGRASVGGAVGLLRDATVTDILPTVQPPLATVLPLDAVVDLHMPSVAAGDLDIDPDVITDDNLPLVFYGLTNSATLRLVKTPAGRLAFDL